MSFKIQNLSPLNGLFNRLHHLNFFNYFRFKTKLTPLKSRILTAAILIALFLCIILFSNQFIFGIISGIVIALAAWEWTRLSGFKSIWARILAFLAMPSLILGFLALIHSYSLSRFSSNDFSFFAKAQSLMSWGVLGFWVLASIAVTIYPRGIKIYQYKIVNLFIGIFVLLPAWFCANLLQAVSPRWLIYPIVLVCVADAAAYFIGRKWGRHHLNSKLSPGKTIEGGLAAIVSAMVVSSIGFFALNVHIGFWTWLLLNLITVLFSIVGDLFESLFKRQQNLKDSGRLLPGHGGVMDRLDSLTAALPIFALGLIM